MTSAVQDPPVVDDEDLLALLSLVDDSRARSVQSENTYLADVSTVYAQRLAYLQAQPEEAEATPVVDAAIMASLVLIIRRALSAGADEGARFASAQFAVLGVPEILFEETELPLTELGDQLVRDFLAGQIAVVKATKGHPINLIFDELHRRAQAAVVSAVQSGRGLAVEQLFAMAAEVLNSTVHKLWVARFDLDTPPCKACVRLHGTHVPVLEAFSVPSTEQAPYRGVLSAPPRHINCRCSLVLFLPDKFGKSSEVTPLSMQMYAAWALSASQEDRNMYVAATLVHVKPYTRVVNGKVQQVSGYYYDIQTGQKFAEGTVNVPDAKQVSAPQAKAITKAHKVAEVASKKAPDSKPQFKPGTYKLDRPGENDDVHVVVHKDGSSTSIYKGTTEDADVAKTAQFLASYDGQGLLTKISDDTKDPTFSKLEPSTDAKRNDATLPEGFYLVPHKDWAGVEVNHDGTGKVWKKDFSKSYDLNPIAIKQIARGSLGKPDEVDEKDFKSKWHKDFESSQAGAPNVPSVGKKDDSSDSSGDSGSASASDSGSASSSASTSGDSGSASASDSGSASSSASTSEKDGSASSSGSASASDGSASASASMHETKPEAPSGGHGDVVKDGPALFSVGGHSVQVEEGSQVYKSGKSKDTLYVLKPDGDLVKYNPQGAGVQATLVGSSDNKIARAQLIAGLNNVTDEGDSIKHVAPLPGTGKALVGSFELSASQIDAALHELESNPSGNVAAALKKAGSPLAAGNFHAVAAPFKAYHNNKTKPALIQALKNAKAHTGSTPLAAAPAVHHLETEHGLTDHHSQLGHADTEAIHQALHAVDPNPPHSHESDAPGFISFSGNPMTPQDVHGAIQALKQSPKTETGIKKPLKVWNSPLAALPFQDLVNASPVTDKYKGSNGKVHYGKIKAAVIDYLQDAYDKHNSVHPAVPKPVSSVPDHTVSVEGLQVTKKDLQEAKDFFKGIDLDTVSLGKAKQDFIKAHPDNPLSAVWDWHSFAGGQFGTPISDHMLNQALNDSFNNHLKQFDKIPNAISHPAPAPSAPSVSEPSAPDVLADTSPHINLPNGLSGSLNQLQQYQNLVNSETPDSEGHTVKKKDNPFSGSDPKEMLVALGAEVPTNSFHQQAVLSDALQKKIDFETKKSEPQVDVAPTSTVSIGGKQVTKQDLLAAIDALKSSDLTGIKGPLKNIDSPLSSVDLKSFVESDPLSAPYKGSNGKVHYGKLKAATAAVLKAKADGVSDAPGPAKSEESSLVTEIGTPEDIHVPEPLDGLTPDLPSPGVYAGAAGMHMTVFEDGTGQITNPYDSSTVNITQGAVEASINSGALTKVSDTVDDIGTPSINGVEEGHYAFDYSSSVSVLPEGKVIVFGVDGDSMMNLSMAKSHILSQGVSPMPFGVDDHTDENVAEHWMHDALTDDSGFLQGDYVVQGHQTFQVTADGPQGISPQLLADSLFTGDAHFVQHTAKFAADEPSPDTPSVDAPSVQPYADSLGPSAFAQTTSPATQAKFDGLVQQAKTAGYQDPWDTSTNDFSVGFQKAVKTGQLHYKTGNGFSVGSATSKAPQVTHYQFHPDGKVQRVSGEGTVLKDFTPAEIVDRLEGAYDGPPASPVHDLPVDSSVPDITPSTDPPYDPYAQFVDEPTSVAPSVPASAPSMDPSAPGAKLSPVLTLGHYQMGWMDKGPMTDAVKKWAEDSGYKGIAGQHLSTAKKDDLASWLKHWANGEWDKAYAIEAAKVKNHKAKLTHPGSPDNPANKDGFKKKIMSPSVDGEVPANVAVPGNWPAPGVDDWHNWDTDQADEYLLAAKMQNPTGLHETHKRMWAQKHHAGDNQAVNSLSLLAQHNVSNNNHKSEPIIPSVPTYGPGQAVPLPPDFPAIDLKKSKAINLSNQQLDQYLGHMGSKKTAAFLIKQPTETKQALVALHAASAALPHESSFKPASQASAEFSDLLTELHDFVQQEDNEKLQAHVHNLLSATPKSFTLDKEQPFLEGQSTLHHVTDEQGSPWLFKVGKSQHRIDIEDAAHKLAGLSGIPVADSLLGKFQGEIGQYQSKIPSKSTLRDVNPLDLPVSALKDLMGHHVQDFTTNNDDSVGRNFLLTPDGNRVVQIDIARAYARFGKPGSVSLNRGALSDWEHVYYEGIYQGIVDGKFDKKDVDSLYRASIKQATKTQNASNENWADILRNGTALRPSFNGTSAKNQEDLIDQAITRKKGLVDSFEKFWDGIYKDAGLEKPTGKSGLAQHVYSGVSQEHIDAAKSIGYAGHSMFFSGTDLEDGHLLTQIAHMSNGKEQLWMSGQLRDVADKKITDWLEKNATGSLSGSSVTQSLEQKSAEMLQQLGYSEAFDKVLGAVKTISHHHKQGDKNYNSARLAAMDELASKLESDKNKVVQGVYPGVLPEQDHQHYSDMLNYYSDQIASAINLRDTGGQSTSGQFKAFDFKLKPDPVIDSPIEKKSNVKVEVKDAYYESGSLDDKNNFQATGQKLSGQSNGQRGRMFVVTLDDGTEIEYRSGNAAYSIPLSQKGQLRVRVRNHDGTTSGSHAAVSQLQSMGLGMTPASDSDHELLYWRHLYGVLQDRADRNTGKQKLVTDYVKSNLPGGAEGTPALTAKEELERWREGWSRLTNKENVAEWVDNQRYLPRFSHPNPLKPEERGGQPYFMRFDANYDEIKNKRLLARFSTGGGKSLEGAVVGGGVWATEDRPKLLGKFIGGMSSGNTGGTNDQDTGASSFSFLTQFGKGASKDHSAIPHQGINTYSMFFSPRSYAKTSTYAFSSDSYGRISGRKTSSNFSLDGEPHVGTLASNNEIQIKHGLTLMDDIEIIKFPTLDAYEKMVKLMKARGITEIRGVPIETRFVKPGESLESAYDEVLKALKKYNMGKAESGDDD